MRRHALFYYSCLLLLLALLVGLRLPLVRHGVFGSDVPNFSDEINYVELAHSLGKGDTNADTTWAYTRAPAASLLLLGLARLRGVPPEFVVADFQLVQVALWGGIMLLVAAITRALFGRRAALLAAGLVAITPEVGLLALLIYSETLFSLGLLGAVAALLGHSRRPHMLWLVLAGLSAGLGALARSTMLPLLPVLAVWAALPALPQTPAPLPFGGGGVGGQVVRRPLRTTFLYGALFLLVAGLAIGPWTVRNYRLYGGLIVVDTTGPINLWFSNSDQPRGEILAAIAEHAPNPVERQRYAAAQAWATISADPGRFAAKVAWQALDTWAPRDFTIRRGFWMDFLQQPLLGSLLAQADSLLTIMLPLALLGFALAPTGASGARHFRLGAAGVLLLFTLTMAATHFEGRYRTPFLLLLLPYGSWCLAHPRCLVAQFVPRTRSAPLAWGTLVLAVALGLYYLPNLWPTQWQSGQALAHYGMGLLQERAGKATTALESQRAALAADPVLRDAGLAAARLELALGNTTAAEASLRAMLRAARRDKDDAPDAVVALQRLLVAEGRAKEAADLEGGFSIPNRRRAELLAWRTGPPPQARLRLGEDDFGRADGFYLRQRDGDISFRWSRPEARLLLSGPGDHLCLRLSAARPAHIAAPTVAISADAVTVGSVVPPRNGWAWLCVPLPNHRPNATLEVALHLPAYNPYAAAVGSDTRDLGVALAEVELRSGPLILDPATGLLLNRAGTSGGAGLTLLGAEGAFVARPGDLLPITLWWRDTDSPSDSVFTFLHLLDANGTTVASYNAPLASGQRPDPWAAAEPLPDHTALPLATLPPGNYRLEAGAFDTVSGAVLTTTDLGAVEVRP